jgi:hypothetical protein
MVSFTICKREREELSLKSNNYSIENSCKLQQAFKA